MSTPQEKLRIMLDDFEQNHKYGSTNPGRKLRELIETTPGLKDDFLNQIAKGHLDHFGAITDGSASARFTDRDNTISLNINYLNDAANGESKGVRTADSLRSTLRHELHHAETKDQWLTAIKSFRYDANKIAHSPSLQHDYTEPLIAYLKSHRSDEVSAEIAGFNALSGYIKNQYPKDILEKLYNASDRMPNYIDIGRENGLVTYKPKPGLTLDNNLQMASSPGNIKAMGKYFYEDEGYLPSAINNAASMISDVEYSARHVGSKPDSSRRPPEPKITVDIDRVLKELDVSNASNVQLPGWINDVKQKQQPDMQRHTSEIAPEGPYGCPYANRYYAALLKGDSDAMDRIAIEFSQTPRGQQMTQMGDE
jgi:hypothetical protein